MFPVHGGVGVDPFETGRICPLPKYLFERSIRTCVESIESVTLQMLTFLGEKK